MNEGRKGEPGIGALLSSLATDTGTLVRQEIHLATTELGQKASKATHQIGVVAIGGALTHCGFMAIIAAIIVALATFVPMWVSALVIGLVAALSGWALVQKGRKTLSELDPLPQKTIETLQQDKLWVKEQLHEHQ